MNEPSNAERPVERPVGHEDGADGSIAIPAEQVETLKEILAEWESGGRWMDREDCKNWKRSAIARENRRESIVLHNCASQIKAWIGRRNLRVLAHASRPDLTERDVAALESAASEIGKLRDLVRMARDFIMEEEITRQTSYEPGDDGYECVEEAYNLRSLLDAAIVEPNAELTGRTYEIPEAEEIPDDTNDS
jgi:hypothetical protein